MKLLFDRLSVQCSKLTTRTYSTSFSLGIFFLGKGLRNPIYSIYGFVRLADEIVDSFDGFDKKKLLEKFKTECYEAIESGISLNPILNTFQLVVHEYKIDHGLIAKFLKSMEMDLYKVEYSKEAYEQYILGSAEVVGLMCLHIFTHENKKLYNELSPFAMKLGSAFQKVNFLRDVRDDFQSLGRTYFPGVDMTEFSQEAKSKVEAEIEDDFRDALVGIKKLPKSSRGGVYLAFVYYKALFKKIKNLPAQKILVERIRISNSEKFRLMFNSMVQFKLNWL